MNYTIRRLLLPENSPLSLPPDHIRLGSDIVISNDTEEPMIELWVAVPMIPEVNSSSPTSKSPTTIYTTTTVHEEDDYMAGIDSVVESGIRKYNEEDGISDDDWNY